MRKNLLLTISVLFLLSFSAQAQLQEHINNGKNAYNKYANKDLHNQIKLTKEVASYNVGDTRMFWRYNLSVMPPSWINQQATCRAVGEKSYVFVADADWGTKMTQEDVDIVFNYLENELAASPVMGIVEMDETYFGTIPDELDNDPKVIFYYSSLGSYNGSVFDGYFSAFNQLTEAEAQMSGEHSNECEMLYMSCYPVDPTSLGTLSVLAHELEHLIHFGHDSNEESWLDEGCAEFAMVLFGQPDPITSFNTNSDNNLTAWNQAYSDYVKTMLFITYLSEHTTGPAFITSLVANSLNGAASIDDQLASISFPIDFMQIFTNWTLANFINDYTVESGLYGYEILDLPAFSYKQHFTSYPASKTTTLNACAASYYKFNTYFSSLEIAASFPQGGEWELNLLTFEDDVLKEVIPFTENILIFNYPESYVLSNLVLVVTNKEIGAGSKTYILSINNISSITDLKQNDLISVFPNPTNGVANIEVLASCRSGIILNLYNTYGQKVLTLTQDENANKTSKFIINISDLKPGMYLVSVDTGDNVFLKKLLVE